MTDTVFSPLQWLRHTLPTAILGATCSVWALPPTTTSVPAPAAMPVPASKVATVVANTSNANAPTNATIPTPASVPAAAPVAPVAPVAPAGEALSDINAIGPLTQRWVNDMLQRTQEGGSALRMEVQVGALDQRLRLAPCARVEPYLPAGSRLWGNTRLGLRCVEGASRWNVFLPITVKAWGPAWVMANHVATGKTLTSADAVQSEVDWAAEPAAIIAHPEGWLGQVATRPLMPGQTVRQTMIRSPEVFRVGAQVRVSVQGPGYVVTSAGQALGAGAVGQAVRVRMDSGRIVGGTVTAEGSVLVPL